MRPDVFQDVEEDRRRLPPGQVEGTEKVPVFVGEAEPPQSTFLIQSPVRPLQLWAELGQLGY